MLHHGQGREYMCGREREYDGSYERGHNRGGTCHNARGCGANWHTRYDALRFLGPANNTQALIMIWTKTAMLLDRLVAAMDS